MICPSEPTHQTTAKKSERKKEKRKKKRTRSGIEKTDERQRRVVVFGEIGGIEWPLVIGVLWKTNREDRDENTERERYL